MSCEFKHWGHTSLLHSNFHLIRHSCTRGSRSGLDTDRWKFSMNFVKLSRVLDKEGNDRRKDSVVPLCVSSVLHHSLQGPHPLGIGLLYIQLPRYGEEPQDQNRGWHVKSNYITSYSASDSTFVLSITDDSFVAGKGVPCVYYWRFFQYLFHECRVYCDHCPFSSIFLFSISGSS